MSEPSEMHARHRRQLAQIAEWGMALLGQVQADAMAAEPEVRAELALKFHRVARGVRQCMALEAQLEREHQRQVCEAVEIARRETAGAAERRETRVRAALTRLVWDEHEGNLVSRERMLKRVDRILAEDRDDPDLLGEPVEMQIDRLRDELGLDQAQLEELRAFADEPPRPPDAPSSA